MLKPTNAGPIYTQPVGRPNSVAFGKQTVVITQDIKPRLSHNTLHHVECTLQQIATCFFLIETISWLDV